MLRALVFDTETTGLIDFKNPASSPTQPDMVELGARLLNLDDEPFQESLLSTLVIPEREIEPKAFEAHGITKEMTELGGISRRHALVMFHQMVKNADIIVAHNSSFDMKILAAAYHRENVDPSLMEQKRRFCTMLKTTDILKLPNPRRPGGYKWPTLTEAYKFFVDENGFEGAHAAIHDVNACAEVLKVLYSKHRELFA